MSNIVFISVFNLGCIEIAENHILSLIRSGIYNYNAYVTDQESYDILSKKSYNVIYYPLEQSTEKMNFGTTGFNDFSYIRYKIINELLNQDKIVWYLDVDTVVFSDLNKLVTEFQSFDVVIQNDINMPCTGCMMFYPTVISKQVVNTIYHSKTSSENDQILLKILLNSTGNYIKLHVLDRDSFANGLLYFNELSDNPKFREIQLEFRNTTKPLYLVHANWMVGIDVKIQELKNKKCWYL